MLCTNLLIGLSGFWNAFIFFRPQYLALRSKNVSRWLAIQRVLNFGGSLDSSMNTRSTRSMSNSRRSAFGDALSLQFGAPGAASQPLSNPDSVAPETASQPLSNPDEREVSCTGGCDQDNKPNGKNEEGAEMPQPSSPSASSVGGEGEQVPEPMKSWSDSSDGSVIEA